MEFRHTNGTSSIQLFFSNADRVQDRIVNIVTSGSQEATYCGKFIRNLDGSGNLASSSAQKENAASFSEFIRISITLINSFEVQYLATECLDGRLAIREYRNVTSRAMHVPYSLHCVLY